MNCFPATEAVAVLHWQEIQSAYTGADRHYHNKQHLEKMFWELDRYPGEIFNRQSLELSIFYHDLVYKAIRKDNEQKSAKRAVEVLANSSLASTVVQQIYDQILATRMHQIPEGNNDPDLPILLDIDLAILGGTAEDYASYTAAVRKEYRIYPDFLYYPGRRKAMQSFLERPAIFHTGFFRKQYEVNARLNIAAEIKKAR